MQLDKNTTIQTAVAVLSLFAAPAAVPAVARAPVAVVVAPASTEPLVLPAPASAVEECPAAALCQLQRQVARRSARWTPDECQRLANAVVSSSRRHGLSPALLVAVMINESDMNAHVYRTSRSSRGVARDSGLMGIRCQLDRRGRCRNALVKGMTWRQVMDPATNIELGARYLAHYRDNVTCRHRDHAFWAHYNHGTRYIRGGRAGYYHHHVAALFHALTGTRGGRRALTVSPLRKRYLALDALVRWTSAFCPADPVLAQAAPVPAFAN